MDLIRREDAVQAVKAYLDLCCLTEAKFHKGIEDYNDEIAREIISVIVEANSSEIPNNCEPKPCEWCKFYDGENCFSQEPCKVMLYFKDEPQTDCAWK